MVLKGQPSAGNTDVSRLLSALYALLWVLPKCFDILSIYALCWPTPPLFFGFRCPHARGVKVSTVIAPRAQSYL